MTKMDSGWIYILRCGWHYKIGKTRNVKKRVAQLQTASPYLIELLLAVYTDNMSDNEKIYHHVMSDNRVIGEWFELEAGDVEWLISDMLRQYEPLVGDIADDYNWVRFMQGDFVEQRQLRKPIEMFPHFPDMSTCNGYFIMYSATPCPCPCHDKEWENPKCEYCKGYGWVFIEDANLCYKVKSRDIDLTLPQHVEYIRVLRDDEWDDLQAFWEWDGANDDADDDDYELLDLRDLVYRDVVIEGDKEYIT